MSDVFESNVLADELDFNLIASEQKDGVCTMTFLAGAFGEEEALCYSDLVTLTFPME